MGMESYGILVIAKNIKITKRNKWSTLKRVVPT